MNLQGVVALVAAKDACPEITETVRALRNSGIASVVVIDDGSSDQTAQYAQAAGARVIRNEHNAGKAAALRRGVEETPDAAVYLLVDADTGIHAAKAAALLDPIADNTADLVIGALPSAGVLGGFGVVKRFAAWGIARGCGFRGHAPLSGQRAIRADLLRSLTFASRFGLEVGMTIDASRAGARIAEVNVDMQHRHRGRRLAGFVHRGRQGTQIAAAFWPRLVHRASRRALLALVMLAVVLVELAFANGNQIDAPNVAYADHDLPVYVIPGWSWPEVRATDLTRGAWASIATADVDQTMKIIAAGSKVPSAPNLDFQVLRAASLDAAMAGAVSGGHALFVGTNVIDGDRTLRPVWLWSADEPAAWVLHSASTKRPGLVDMVDLAPTVLVGAAGSTVPTTVQGQPIWLENGNPASLPGIASQVHLDNQWRPYVIGGLTVLVLLAAALAVPLLRKSSSPLPTWRRGARWTALVLAAIPLATYVVRWISPPVSWGISGRSTLLVAIVVIILGMAALAAPSTWVSLRRILAATVLLLLGDLMLGSNLQFGSIFGSDPTLGSRYYGLGNPASVLLLTGTILLVAMHVQASSDRRSAVARGTVVFLAVTLADGLPGLGSDVGGMLAFLVTCGIAIYLLADFPLSWRRGLALVGLAAAAFTVGGLLDSARPAASQTHLGRLFSDIADDGLTPLFQVVLRKVDANLFSYAFPWSLVLLALAVTSLILLWRTDVWSNLMPVGSVQRVGAGLAVLGGLLLFALNDSGIVVLALVSVYLIPFVLVQERLTFGQSSGHLNLEVSTK